MDQPKCGFWDQLTGNAIVCSDTFHDYQLDVAKDNIQSVADNARDAYGADSLTAQIAQATADANKKASLLDILDIDNGVENSPIGKVFDGDCDGAPGVDLGFIGGGCFSYDTLKKYGLIAGVVVVAAVVLYAVGIVQSFLPRRG